MHLLKLYFVVVASAFAFYSGKSQNVLLNILTQNSGIVEKGKTIFLEVTVCNTDATDSIPVYKLRPQISVPSGLAIIPVKGHILPSGWAILNNDGSTIRLSNGTDTLPSNECRTILIAIQGKAIGGPETVSGNMLFSNGVAPGSFSGPATLADNPADNSSTSTCKVIR